MKRFEIIGTIGLGLFFLFACSSTSVSQPKPVATETQSTRTPATTDPELTELVNVDWATQRLINLFAAWRIQFVEILDRLGMTDIQELVGRTDCLRHLDYEGAKAVA